MTTCPAKFQDSTLHPSVGFCAGMVKSVSRYFKVGDKVYPTRVEVNLDKAKIAFSVVSCDSCNGVDPPTSMKGEVNFQFPKGYLEKASVGEIEDMIGKVFSISNDDQQNENQQNSNQQNQGGNDAGQQGGQQGGQQQQQQQQAEPQTIQLGMSPDQVEAALGKPDKIFNVGTKQIYVYKDVKVTFLKGKVSDVQ